MTRYQISFSLGGKHNLKDVRIPSFSLDEYILQLQRQGCCNIMVFYSDLQIYPEHMIYEDSN